MANFAALYDASVLYPAPLRDLLLRLSATGLFRACWTDQILEECFRSVLAKRPDLSRDRLERTRHLISQHFSTCFVTDYESLIPSIELPDHDDRHVVAAAIVGRADVIVTFNLKHFPRERLEPFGLVAQHPDEFIWHLCDLDMPAICAVVRAQWQDLVHPSRTLEQFLDTLLRQGLAKSVATLRGCGFDG